MKAGSGSPDITNVSKKLKFGGESRFKKKKKKGIRSLILLVNRDRVKRRLRDNPNIDVSGFGIFFD